MRMNQIRIAARILMATGSTTATTFGYCVDGKTMHLMMLDPGIVYDIIAQRP